jgi:cytochrome d ubiquinol oxidase subunit II
MIDYELLRLIWWAIVGVLLIGFAILDGFDLGVGMMLPFLGRTDCERRIMINTVGPVWEGNQVWLIVGAGASFAAWPYLYAVSFSGFYLAIFIALFGIILRPVGFKFRSKIDNPVWRQFWDCMLFLGGFLPALVFGVAFGNLFLGVPFHFDDDLRIIYSGRFFDLFHPFALLTGLISVCLCLFQGANYLAVKTYDPVSKRASRMSYISGGALLILVSSGWSMITQMKGHAIAEFAGYAAPSNPLFKTVLVESGGWMHNHAAHPLLWGVVGLVYVSVFLSIVFQKLKYARLSFVSSSVSIAMTISLGGLTLYPFLMPSSINPSHGLTLWDSSSSQKTLMVMLIATLLFLPVILCYTAWVYRVMRGKVGEEEVNNRINAY